MVYGKRPEITRSFPSDTASGCSTRRDEVVTAPVADGDFREGADGEFLIDHHRAVDLRGVPFGAADAFLLDEDADFFADLRLVRFRGDFLEGGHGARPAAFAGHVVEVAVELHGAGALFLGVLENPGALEAEFLDEIQQLLEVLLRLAGETYDERSTNAEAGDARAHAAQQVADVIAGGHALHGGQHPIGNVLERDIDVFRDLVALGDRFDQLVRPMGGVGVEQAHPEIAFDLVNLAEEGAEGIALRGIDR